MTSFSTSVFDWLRQSRKQVGHFDCGLCGLEALVPQLASGALLRLRTRLGCEDSERDTLGGRRRRLGDAGGGPTRGEVEVGRLTPYNDPEAHSRVDLAGRGLAASRGGKLEGPGDPDHGDVVL